MGQAPISLYPYKPSTAAAILFTTLYSIAATAHTYLYTIYPRFRRCRSHHHNPSPRSSTSCKSRCSHRYAIPTAIAAGLSTVGYAVRIVSINKDHDIGIYASSSSYIVIAPIFVCATLYLLFSRLILHCLPASSPTHVKPQVFLGIPPHWLGRLFVTSDIFSFLTQGSGSAIAASGNWSGDSATIGTNILLVGLSLQLATFTAFLIMLTLFVRRVHAVKGTFEPNVQKLLVGVAVAGVCVEIRSVYRVVEFALGLGGYPFTHEWPLYVFEAVPMWVATGAGAWWHSIRLVPEGFVAEKMEGSSGSGGGDGHVDGDEEMGEGKGKGGEEKQR